MLASTVVALFLTQYTYLVLSWDPDAGMIPSWTSYPGVKVQVTSNPTKGVNIIDGQEKTHWQSGACMPTGFLNRAELNTLLGVCATEPSLCATSGNSDPAGATDGSFYTTTSVEATQGEASFIVQMKKPKRLYKIAVRGVYRAPTKLWALSSAGWRILRVFTDVDSYKFLVFSAADSEPVAAIKVNSSQKFQLIEIAVLAQHCYEKASVDLGAAREVQVIRTRHWSPHATNTTLLTSMNGQDWTDHAQLDPAALRSVVTRLPRPVMAKFVAVRHQVKEGNYKKAYVWEVEAWDQYGQWGSPPLSRQQAYSLEELLGVNGIWGWGFSKYSDSVPPGEGPDLYASVGTHGRNYHNMNWDVTDPDHVPDYRRMAQGGGTEAQWWLNWDREYSAWQNKGLTVHASIQFLSSQFPASVWDDPHSAGEGYGRAFAHHFGPSHGNGLVSAMEVGNEPWKYKADMYKHILRGMVEGAKSADPNMTVLPCALQAHDPSVESPTFGNYIGARVDESAANNIDVINLHMYSYLVNEDGRRVAVHPEHTDSEFNAIRNMLRWRDVNMPGRPVWVTEWGWDSDGAGEGCSFSECVTERAQAIYGVRGLLILARNGVERATWYFYANTDNCKTLFCRSGLTGSKNVSFAEKNSLKAFRTLRLLMGGKYFLKTLREDENAFVYLFGERDGSPTHLVAWRPVSADDVIIKCASFDLKFLASPKSAWRVSGDSNSGEPTPSPVVHHRIWTMLVSTVPTVVELKHP